MFSESQERFIQPARQSRSRLEIRAADLTDIPVNISLREGIEALLTPKEALTREVYSKPEIIYPPYLPDFASLRARREDIRTLALLPAKSEEEYVRYHGFSREELVERVDTLLGQDPLVMAENEFPYFLPDDVRQTILWIKSFATDDATIAEFLGKAVQHQDLTLDEVILFERPLTTDAKMIRGTLPEYRHIHVWTPTLKE